MNIQTFIKEYLPVYIKGLMMGLCDIIPGVSGGTVAFITGIYGRLISAVAHISPLIITDILKRDFNTVKFRLSEMDIPFLIILAGGIGTAFIIASRVMLHLLHEFPAQTNGFFLGLIVASSILLYSPLPSRYPGSIIFLAVGILIGLGIVMINPTALGHSYPVLFLTGFIALCAMILPGISGAYITLLMNQYEYMLIAIKSASLPDIAVYMAGGVVGILTFTRLLRYLMKYYHDAIVAVLTGLMLGSAKLLFDRATETVPPGAELIGSALAGIVLVLLLQLVSEKMKKRAEGSGSRNKKGN